ncbi:soluble lytic murein transglycosylase [Natronospira proteinivora]|uniref:Soluble lytic murein transglycosylase n=1 Tax=Natronospira proteinivora TaxID=1807133 RepID=A0ABT1GAF5_9GAMM|nr:lytic transglycosylase domain-containing protein [Natronospira proteinivora]MCP1728309.1 soluble lytic murein transglycosylase [Natronospira proteinivora]
MWYRPDEGKRFCTAPRPFPFKALLALTLLAFLPATVMANHGSDDPVRDFTQALLAGEPLPYPPLVLDDHPAMPWLKMQWMRPRLGELDAEEVIRFISRHRHRPFAAEFRRDWLVALGQAERWRDFDRYYRGERDQTLQCLHLQSRLVRDDEGALRAAAGLWLTGRTLPRDCEPLFAAAREAGEISDYMVAERFRLALNRDNLALATELAPQVGEAAVAQVDRLRAIRQNPRSVLDNIDPARAGEAAIADFVAATKRLARQDPVAAHERFEAALAEDLETTDQQRFLVQRRLALEAARDHLPQAEAWLEQTPANDQFIRAWRIRNALRLGDWTAALEAIDSHPHDNSRQWQYWRARALEQLGREDEARRLYTQLASDNAYYGILANRRLGRAIETEPRIIEADATVLAQLRSDEDLQLARALLDVGWETAARTEWRQVLNESPRHTRCQSALLAHEWGWSGEAVRMAARSGCRGDPRLDYPLAFADYMKPSVARLELDASWAWSIMRAESLFAIGAESHVGALGLMQLMPGTAREVARDLELELNGSRDIIDPAHNIQLGTGYLRQMLDRFDGHPLVATAAYNAGPHRAQAWLPEEGTLDGDVWAEIVPFRETRRYIRRVMTHSLGFDRQLDAVAGNGDRLAMRMAPVGETDPESCLLATTPELDEEITLSC